MKSILIIAALVAVPCGPLLAQPVPQYDGTPKITVNGDAVVNVTPDKIVVRVGIETWHGRITTAKEKNNRILKLVMEALAEAGIADKDIKTDYLAIDPDYDGQYPRREIVGYHVRNTLAITLKEVEKLESVVATLLEAGVTHIHGIEFETTEFKKYREQAREMALTAAKEKAETMAGTLGQTIGAPLQITENYSGSPGWYYSSWSWWGGFSNGGMMQNAIQNAPGEAGDTGETIALGTIPIKAGVTVTFELAKR